MSKMLRSISNKLDPRYCHCCGHYDAISHRAIEKRKYEEEVSQELNDIEEERTSE